MEAAKLDADAEGDAAAALAAGWIGAWCWSGEGLESDAGCFGSAGILDSEASSSCFSCSSCLISWAYLMKSV